MGLKYREDRLVFVCRDGKVVGCCNIDGSRFERAESVKDCIESVTHIHKNGTLQEALGLMISAGIANVVVTGDGNAFLGVLSFVDMTDFLQMHQEGEEVPADSALGGWHPWRKFLYMPATWTR